MLNLENQGSIRRHLYIQSRRDHRHRICLSSTTKAKNKMANYHYPRLMTWLEAYHFWKAVITKIDWWCSSISTAHWHPWTLVWCSNPWGFLTRHHLQQATATDVFLLRHHHRHFCKQTTPNNSNNRRHQTVSLPRQIRITTNYSWGVLVMTLKVMTVTSQATHLHCKPHLSHQGKTYSMALTNKRLLH